MGHSGPRNLAKRRDICNASCEASDVCHCLGLTLQKRDVLTGCKQEVIMPCCFGSVVRRMFKSSNLETHNISIARPSVHGEPPAREILPAMERGPEWLPLDVTRLTPYLSNSFLVRFRHPNTPSSLSIGEYMSLILHFLSQTHSSKAGNRCHGQECRGHDVG